MFTEQISARSIQNQIKHRLLQPLKKIDASFEADIAIMGTIHVF